MAIVALLTDFGSRDHYVAAMKGVILGIAPGTAIVDITHEVEPQNIEEGAYVLGEAFRWFPAGTVFIGVVDPGVGTSRQIVAAAYRESFVIAPDNGLLSRIDRTCDRSALHQVANDSLFLAGRSTTFHGRDIMAPTAAHLVNGGALEDVGPVLNAVKVLPRADPDVIAGGGWRCRVIHVDRFGTMITNLSANEMTDRRPAGAALEVRVNGLTIGPVHTTFADVPPGEPVAFVGSGGNLEIAVNRGSAVERFGRECQPQVVPTPR